jgi:LPS sulfotransferase NodH
MSNPDGGETRGYVICTVPRSGSNWLGQLLSSTGVLGHPLEYFNAAGRRQISDPSFPGRPKDQVQRILTSGRTVNGVYGVKMFAVQFHKVSRKIRLTQELPRLRFITLARRDVLGQAISWTRALQTEQYRGTQKIRRAPVYDKRAITRQLRIILDEYRVWAEYFARTGPPAAELAYEDLIDDPRGGVDRIAALFGVTATLSRDGVDLNVQRDALSQEWRRRFIDDMGDPDRL